LTGATKEACVTGGKMEALGQDVLFWETTDGGHGGAVDHQQQAELATLVYVYLAQKLGLKAPAH